MAVMRARIGSAHRAKTISRRLVMAVPMPTMVQAWMMAAARWPSAAAQPKMMSHTMFAACMFHDVRRSNAEVSLTWPMPDTVTAASTPARDLWSRHDSNLTAC